MSKDGLTAALPPAEIGTGTDDARQAAADFARRSLRDRLSERDREGAFSRDAWLACARFGVQGLPLPPEFGGSGADLRTTIAVMEGLGEGGGDNGLLFSLNAQLWSVELPLLTFGTDDQRARYLPRLCSGEIIGAHAMTEPGSGSDAFSLKTRAERQGDHYVLSGRKSFITNAPVADIFLVYATADPSLGMAGVSAFLVERSTPGLVVERDTDKMGLRTSPMADVLLDGCAVGVDARLGREGAGSAVFNSAMDWERAAILSTAVGAMERELARCVEYAKAREQFRQPIGKFPAVAGRLADMKVRLDASRGLLERLVVAKERDRSATVESAVAKLYISEAWVQSSLDAQLVYGAFGYVRENAIEREIRDALGTRFSSGTSDIMRAVIARSLGL